jgi:4-alpha-glucanotransferase
MMRSRLAGVVLPLFSVRTKRDWGIGQITDIPACAVWAQSAGHSLLQVLPPYELADGETSPYGARTAFGLDPIYIDIDAVSDLDPVAIAEALGAEGRASLERVRAASHVLYREVRAIKTRALRMAFERFHAREWEKKTRRADELRAFIANERSWLDDLALYVALRDSHAGHGWESWPISERDREPVSMARARGVHARRILEYQYTQWLALGQWDAARRETHGLGVELMGDLPFVVCAESSDVWAHREQFRRDASLGAPPDTFSPDGQDWGLPPYDWAAMDKDDLAWIRARTRHAARLYDRFRLDHVVGYFRMYLRRKGEAGFFEPSGDDAQRARGERVLRAILESASGSRVIGEDLGVIPPFVRQSLTQLRIPGYRVVPWERGEDHVLRDPHHFPQASVATWSTHDTSPITRWWDEMQPYERADLAKLANLPAEAARAESTSVAGSVRRHALLRLLFESSSDVTLVLAQELYGDRERINTPGTVGPENWTYRLPRPIEELTRDPTIAAQMAATRDVVIANGRIEANS